MEETIEDLKLKIDDFNIFDVVKGKSPSKGIKYLKLDGGPVETDKFLLLLQNLERKVFKKFDLVDEKIKGFQDEIYKKKNDILNIMTSVDNSQKKTNSTIESLVKDFNEKNISMNNLIISKENELKFNLQEQIALLSDYINTKFKEVSSNLPTQSNQEKNHEELEKDIEKSKQGISESDLKLIKDLTKRVSDLDKAFRILNK